MKSIRVAVEVRLLRSSPNYSLPILAGMFAVLLGLIAAPLLSAQTVTLAAKPGVEIGAEVNSAIASLPNKTGTIELPAGSFSQATTIKVTGSGIHLVGSPAGTTLNYNPANYRLLDSADSSEGWRGSGVSVGVLASFGEDHPDPMEGSGYMQVATGQFGRQVAKTIPATDFTTAAKIGVWMTLNLTNESEPVEFFVSDGSRTAYWSLTPSTIYASWKFFGLDRASPSGIEGGSPDMTRITLVGFRKLIPEARYYFDAISLYTPQGPSIQFSSCIQCSLSNLTVRWEPAADTDAAILANQNTSELTLSNVHTIGGGDGISFTAPSTSSTCENCTAEFASQGGVSLRGATTGNRLFNPQVNRNVIGIFIAAASSHNAVSSARCVRNDSSGLFIEGNNNEITNAYIETWMTFGLVIRGGAENTLSGITAISAVGESAVQLIAGAADNKLSSINIEQAGGSGLDLGGGVKPQVRNTATDVVVHNSGSSSWHGGPKATSEGRGLCLCNAKDNRITRLSIYDTGQKSNVSGAEGIIMNNGSSGNVLEDVTIYNSRHEGVTIWDASNNTLRNVRLVGNGMKEGNGPGVRIAAASQNIVLENVCFWMNGGGGVQNLSSSTVMKNTRQVKDLDPKAQCQ